MKRNICLSLIVLLFFIAVGAQAQEREIESSCYCEEASCGDEANFYARLLAGANFLQKTGGNKSTYQTGYVIAGSLGYYWRDGFQLEAEYAYRRNGIKKIHFLGQGVSKHGHLQASSYMVNLLWDLPIASWGYGCWNLRPFIGAGIGYDFQQLHSSNCRVIFNEKWNHFSWQVMTGVAYPILCNTEVTLEYKFHQGGTHFYNHSLGIGLVYRFGFFISPKILR